MLVDSNTFMYAAGAAHRNKQPSVSFLECVSTGKAQVCVSTEILPENLHRYRSIVWGEDGKQVFMLAREIVPRILPIDRDSINRAYGYLEGIPNIMARHPIHAVIC
ncbi:MAG: hypothetical protein GF344_19175 [Chitinivibrionales bacterium]|nr:hypothetical protein [Chitinivibrionales bacterium]MBD3358748.1 hypothetical protein [Chitinivibrionales bacterium]